MAKSQSEQHTLQSALSEAQGDNQRLASDNQELGEQVFDVNDCLLDCEVETNPVPVPTTERADDCRARGLSLFCVSSHVTDTRGYIEAQDTAGPNTVQGECALFFLLLLSRLSRALPLRLLLSSVPWSRVPVLLSISSSRFESSV